MIQTVAEKISSKEGEDQGNTQQKSNAVESKAKMPLAGRLDTLEKEITSLQERLAVMQSEIMGAEGALVQTGAKKPDDLALLKAEKKQGVTIKDRTATAETNVAELHGGLSILENQVKGDAAASLLALEASGPSGSNLKDRIAHLEKQVGS